MKRIYLIAALVVLTLVSCKKETGNNNSGGGSGGNSNNGEIAGQSYVVDLGLPSGLKWASCNVGADSPEDYGDYFAWGEISPKDEYITGNNITFGEQMDDISSNAQYDAATANWGEGWRMPTKEEMQELNDECIWTWTTYKGVYGCQVTGPNGNSIFLPAAGYRTRFLLDYDGYIGYYWSSTPNPYDSGLGAYYFYFCDGDNFVDWSTRDFGHSVRPVRD